LRQRVVRDKDVAPTSHHSRVAPSAMPDCVVVDQEDPELEDRIMELAAEGLDRCAPANTTN